MRLAVAAASRLRMRAAARRWHTAIECALPWRQQAADVTAIERTNQQAASQISCPLTGAADCTAIEWRLAMPAASRYSMRAGNRMRLTALPADCR